VKDKIIYKETYKKPYPKVLALPKWNEHINEGYEIKEVQVKSTGKIEYKGKECEFQELLFIFGDKPELIKKGDPK
jgi:hypothetical protein